MYSLGVVIPSINIIHSFKINVNRKGVFFYPFF